MKHTSGKWEVTETIGIHIKSGDVFIAGIHSQDKRNEDKKVWEDGAFDKSETRANSNLIASAPDMLEALKEVHKWISLSEYEYNKHLTKVCEKAIAKAEVNNQMQRGITKYNRLEANSSPIAESSVKAVSLKRNNKMKKIFKNTLFKKGATIQKFRFALYFMDYVVIDLDLGRNKSINVSWFELRICGVGIDINRNENALQFNNIYNRYWCK